MRSFLSCRLHIICHKRFTMLTCSQTQYSISEKYTILLTHTVASDRGAAATSYWLIVAHWRHKATELSTSIRRGNSLLPSGIKPSPESLPIIIVVILWQSSEDNFTRINNIFIIGKYLVSRDNIYCRHQATTQNKVCYFSVRSRDFNRRQPHTECSPHGYCSIHIKSLMRSLIRWSKIIAISLRVLMSQYHNTASQYKAWCLIQRYNYSYTVTRRYNAVQFIATLQTALLW